MPPRIPNTVHEIPDLVIGSESMDWNHTGSWRSQRPIIREKAGSCVGACPVHNPIPEAMTELANGNVIRAAEIWITRNPFPSVTGRVCPHFCETACNRKRYDEAINIRAVERFLGDAILRTKGRPPDTEREERISVVGSGPGGLAAAYHLRRKGFKVDVFERSFLLGGILREGIPAYRLPYEIVDHEIKALKRMGIAFHTNKEMGKDFSLDDLRRQYRAVFLALGAHKETRMKIEGEDLLWSGLEFLKEVARGKAPQICGTVAVIGGGNVAMDVIRTVKRLGARPVLIYRRTENEMPAIAEEVHRAQQEGIEFRFLTAPVKARKEGDRLLLTLVRMQLGEKDASGRPRPVPVEGSDEDFPVDFAIKAVGEFADMSLLPADLLDDKGWLSINKKTMQTKIPGVFAGGDYVTGPATVIEAIADGHTAARSIEMFLDGREPDAEPRTPSVPIKGIRLEYFPRAPRAVPDEVPLAERTRAFGEEVMTLSDAVTIAESLRCFSCGVCNLCGNCWVFCPDVAVRLKGDLPEILYDYCKGCGVCAAECPRSVIQMEDEVWE
jgi:NADPH-dependent glutamate synthase beta subunit-like oxidoreductase/ferredoxin